MNKINLKDNKGFTPLETKKFNKLFDLFKTRGFRGDKNKTKFLTGFSLIELLVSIAILVIVSGLVFFNQSGFNNSVLVENLAYEISLTIRQAQSYGLQSKETEIGVGSTFQAGYGVCFDISATGNNKELILYSDLDGNHVYSSGDGEVDKLKLTNGNEIVQLCTDSVCTVTKLDVAFVRPNPIAYINVEEGVGSNVAEIYIQSPQDVQKKIVVNKIGQIAVESI